MKKLYILCLCMVLFGTISFGVILPEMVSAKNTIVVVLGLIYAALVVPAGLWWLYRKIIAEMAEVSSILNTQGESDEE